jgi:hypothetical protein
MFVKNFILFIGCILFTTGESVASTRGGQGIVIIEKQKSHYTSFFYGKTTDCADITKIISTAPLIRNKAIGNSRLAIVNKLFLPFKRDNKRQDIRVSLRKINLIHKGLILKGTPRDTMVMTNISLQKQVQEQEQPKPVSKKNNGFIISLFIVAITLLIVLLFAAKVRKLQKKMHG